jgi:fatty acid desaturase
VEPRILLRAPMLSTEFALGKDHGLFCNIGPQQVALATLAILVLLVLLIVLVVLGVLVVLVALVQLVLLILLGHALTKKRAFQVLTNHTPTRNAPCTCYATRINLDSVKCSQKVFKHG